MRIIGTATEGCASQAATVPCSKLGSNISESTSQLVSIFWHVRLGLQVLIEDYVHDDGNKFAALTLLNFYVIGAAAFGIFMVAKHAFTGAPA